MSGKPHDGLRGENPYEGKMQWPPRHPRMFSREGEPPIEVPAPDPAAPSEPCELPPAWSYQHLAELLGYRKLTLRLLPDGRWNVQVRSLRRVVFNADVVRLGDALVDVLVWAESGCLAPKVERCDCTCCED